ncbi:MAG: hydroxymethylbilane synthase [Chloroflexi bacterium]|nr:hydroxymethylbilane synthase [Chloroflexota bacterium]
MSTTTRPLVVGTRGSPLALVQTQLVLDQLRKLHPHQEFVVEVRSISTEGDRTQAQDVPLQQLAGRGVFVKDLEVALLEGAIDLAVHSLKDMTSELQAGLVIAAVPEREDPRDVLVSQTGGRLDSLPEGARVGSSSPRRAAQLRALRPDLRFEPIRGNVDTRVRKVERGEYDAAVLAAAGLVRLGLADRIAEYFPSEVCLPDPGQGALAVEVRADDARVLTLLAPLNHPETWAAVTAERALLKALGGGCQVPIAAFGEATDGRLTLHGLVASPEDGGLIRSVATGALDAPEALGQSLAESLLAKGARRFLALP